MKKLSLIAGMTAMIMSSGSMSLELGDMLYESVKQSVKINTADHEPTVLDISKEFNHRYPTNLFTLIINNAEKAKSSSGEGDGVFYDAKNNSLIGQDPRNDESPTLKATLFKSGADHYLFMLTATMELGGLYSDESHYFDIDWKTGEMKPLNDYAPGGYQPPFKSYGTVTQSDFADARNNIIIGYEITDGLFMNLSSHFSWDGGTHKFAGSDIQLPKQQKILPKNVNAKDLKYYAFYDIDDDGNSEIFLSNKDHSIEISAVIRSYEKAEKELLTRRDGGEFKFYKGGIAVTGSCGSGCSAADYVLVNNSGYGETLNVRTLTAPDGGKEITYTAADEKGGQKISAEKADEFMAKLGEEKQVQLDWQPIISLNFNK